VYTFIRSLLIFQHLLLAGIGTVLIAKSVAEVS